MKFVDYDDDDDVSFYFFIFFYSSDFAMLCVLSLNFEVCYKII